MTEMPQAYVHDQPKARKEHKCYECRGKIAAGETYHYHHGIWDGDALTFKVCSDCEALRAEIDAELRKGDCWAEGTPFGSLAEAVVEGKQEADLRRFIEIQTRRGSAVRLKLSDFS